MPALYILQKFLREEALGIILSFPNGVLGANELSKQQFWYYWYLKGRVLVSTLPFCAFKLAGP